MPDADDINDAMATNATGPKRVKSGNHEIEQHSLKDQIDAAEKLANISARSNAASQPHFGLRFTKIVPPEAG